MSFALLLSLALAATSAPELEAQAQRELGRKFERGGRPAPLRDEALTQAARSLARLALTTRAVDVADLVEVSDAVSGAGGHDASPRALVLRSTPAELALQSLAEHRELSQEAASHAGVGAAVDGERGALIVLLSHRKARLEPFPRAFKEGGAVKSLCGEFEGALRRAELYLTSPDGAVSRLPLTEDGGKSFCGTLAFPKPGRYTVEVIGRGDRGPEVAALFFVDVGEKRKAAALKAAEPTTLPAARAEILERVNALRRAHGQPDVEADPALDKIAQAYSERMALEGFFSHVAPDGTDLRARMRAAGYAYRAAGENLGSAAGPLAAHFGIEHSPGHRQNLLVPGHSRLGVGVVFKRQAERTQVIVTELLAEPELPSFDPLGDSYEAISRARRARGLAPLARSEVLEQIAFDHAKKALAADTPKSALPGHTPVQDRVFAATAFKSAAVDVFVAESLSAVTSSKNTFDDRSDQVGIGAVRGTSRTLGPDRYWVVVIYASSR